MSLGAFRLNTLSALPGVVPRTASTFAGTRNTTTGKFGTGYNQTSSGATLTLPAGTKIGGGSAGTIEFWFKLNNISNQVKFAGNDSGLQIMCNTGNGSRVRIAPNNYSGEYANEWDVSTGVWHHLAITTAGSNLWKHYVNGTQRHTGSGWSWSGNITDFAFGGNNSAVVYDEIRFSKTVRYASSFTAPTGAFTNDTDTLALFHCESNSETDDIA